MAFQTPEGRKLVAIISEPVSVALLRSILDATEDPEVHIVRGRECSLAITTIGDQHQLPLPAPGASRALGHLAED